MARNNTSDTNPVSKADIPDVAVLGAPKKRWLTLGRFLSMKQSAAAFLLGLIMVLSGSLSYVFYQSIDSLLTQEIEKRAFAVAREVAESATFGVLLSDPDSLANMVAPFLSEEDVAYIWLLDKHGKLILPNIQAVSPALFDDVLMSRVMVIGVADSRIGNIERPITGQPAFMGYHVAMPIWHEKFDNILDATVDANNPIASDRELIGMVQVGLSMERVREQTRLAMFRSGFLVVGITFFTLVMAATLLHRWLEPLQVVTGMATRIRSEGYEKAVKDVEAFKPATYDRSAVHGRFDEIGQLYQTFTEMMQELERHDKRLKEQKKHLSKMVDDRTKELSVAKEEAEAANEAKSTFLASMGQEIRTPLNTVISFAEMLQHQPDLPEEKRVEYVTAIHASSSKLLSLIDDILDLSRLEAGGYELKEIPFNLRASVQATYNLSQPRMLKKQIEGTLHCDDAQVITDERVLRQILINLLSNAVKFTQNGDRIDVNLKVTDGTLLLEVCDSGVGMSEDETARALISFEKVGAAKQTTQSEGTGLGLTIVQRFVTLLGGKVHIYSEKGQGTVVRLTIPVGIA